MPFNLRVPFLCCGLREPSTDQTVVLKSCTAAFMQYLFIGLIYLIQTALLCSSPSLMISSLQVTTSIEQQATESSLCERNTTAGLSAQGKNSRSTEHCRGLSAGSHADDTVSPIFSLGGQRITDGVRGG